MNLPISTAQIIQYLNIFFIVLIGLGALIGFGRGTRKSIFFLIWTAIVFGGAVLIMNVKSISSRIYNFDLSSFGLVINGVPIQSINQALPELVNVMLQESNIVIQNELLAEGSYTYELIIGIANILFKIVFYLATFVLSFTLWYVIGKIIWLFFRPRKKVVMVGKKEKKRRPKPSFISRIIGMGLGGVKGVFYTLLFGFIIAGIASVSSSVRDISTGINGNEELAIVYNGDSITVVDLSTNINEEKNNDPLQDFEPIFEVLDGYRNTIAGKVFSSIKVGKDEAYLDEALFDSIFSIKGKNGSLKLRNELKSVVNILSNETVKKLINDKEALNNISQEDIIQLKTAVDALASLDIIKIVVPVGIDFIVYSNTLESALKDNYNDVKQLLDEKYEELVNLNYASEVKKIGYTFVDIASLLGGDLKNPKNIDFFSLDQNTVKSICTNIGQLGMIDIVSPIAINYLLSTEQLKNALNELGMTAEDLNLTDSIDLGDELINLANVYEKVCSLGIKMVDSKVNLDDLNVNAVSGLVSSIFDSVIIKNAIPNLVPKLTKFIPEEYSNIINQETLTDVNWEDELSPLLTGAAVLVKSGILNEKDILKAIVDMEDNDFVDLGRYISKSKVLTSNIDNIIDTLMGSLNSEINIVGLDSEKGEKWDEEEIVSLFSATKQLLNLNIISAEDKLGAISALSNDDIDKLADNLSKSKFFTKNLDNIMDFVLSSLKEGMTIQPLDKEAGEIWDKKELSSIFKSLKIIIDSNLIKSENMIETFKTMPNSVLEDISLSISSSTFLTKNISSLIEMLVGNLGFPLVSLEKEEWTANEIYSILSSAKTISQTLGEGVENINVADLLNLSDSAIDIILESKLLLGSLIEYLNAESLPGKSLEILKGIYPETNSYYNWYDELVSVNVSKDNHTLLLTKNDNAIKYIVYRNNMFFTSTSSLSINLDTIEGYVYSEEDTFEAKAIINKGEIRKIINSISLMDISDLNSFSIDMRVVVNNKNELLSSYIITHTLIDQIQKLADGSGDLITLPEEFKVGGSGKWISDNEGAGELENIISALDLALGISSSVTPFDINSINASSIKLSNIIDNRNTIFNSSILSATVVKKIQDLGTDGTITIPLEYKGDYKVWMNDGSNEGELSILLGSLSNVVSIPESGFTISTESIDLKKIISKKDEILKSAILTSTIVGKIVGVEDITIPNEFKLTSDLSYETGYTKWKNVYENGTVKEEGELSKLFTSLDLALGISSSVTPFDINSINASSIKLSNIIDNRNTIFNSSILSATVVKKIQDLGTDGTITIPLEYKGDYKVWMNDGSNEGELSILLGSLSNVVSIPESGFTISTESIDLKKIISKKDEILKSAILTSTIVGKIVGVEDITIPNEFKLTSDLSYETGYTKWKNVYENGTVKEEGELSKLFTSLDLALGISSSVTPFDINSINASSIKLSNIIDNRNTIFNSSILSATVVKKIQDLGTDGTITIPTEYKGDYKVWMNDGSKEGELSILLGSLSNVVSIPESGFTISTESIDLRNIINEEDEILKSAILTATIVNKILNIEATSITIPNEYRLTSDLSYETGYTKWKNSYVNNSVSSRGELSFILNAIDKLLNISSQENPVSINNIDTLLNTIYLESILNNSDTILLSKIIASTIKQKIIDINNNGINIPINYASDNWYNVYDVNYNLTSKGEISRLLEALKVALDLDENSETSISNIDINTLELGNLTSETNRNILLNSDILTETLKVKMIELASVESPSIYLPSGYNNESSNNYFVWESTYNNDVVTEYGELYYILQALDIIKGESSINDLSKINYASLFDELYQDEILRSKVISETIIVNLTKVNISIPQNYNLDNPSDRSEWYNDYSGNSVVHKELSALLSSIKELIGSSALESLNTSNIQFGNIFNSEKQELILKSKIVSETIIQKIEELGTFSIPSSYGLKLEEGHNRDEWFNEYNQNGSLVCAKELARLINSLGQLLTIEQKNNLQDINIDDNINTIINGFQDNSYKNVLLKSYVMCETLKSNVQGFKSLKDKHNNSYIEAAFQDYESHGITIEWYKMDENGNPEEKELWNLLTGISCLLDNQNINDLNEFTIESIISNSVMKPTYSKSTLEVTSSHIAKTLDSIILERIFADIVSGLFDTLDSFITIPSPFVYYSYDVTNENEHDLVTFLESYYLISPNYISILSGGLGDTNKIFNMTESELDDLAAGMAISRTFRGSIAQFVTNTSGTLYQIKALMYPITPWNEVKLVQEDYNGLQQVEIYNKFKIEYQYICDCYNQ